MQRLDLEQLLLACCPRAELKSFVVRESLGCRVSVQMASPDDTARVVTCVNNRVALTLFVIS